MKEEMEKEWTQKFTSIVYKKKIGDRRLNSWFAMETIVYSILTYERANTHIALQFDTSRQTKPIITVQRQE